MEDMLVTQNLSLCHNFVRTLLGVVIFSSHILDLWQIVTLRPAAKWRKKSEFHQHNVSRNLLYPIGGVCGWIRTYKRGLRVRETQNGCVSLCVGHTSSFSPHMHPVASSSPAAMLLTLIHQAARRPLVHSEH